MTVEHFSRWCRPGPRGQAGRMSAQAAQLETFTPWMNATRQARVAALEATLSHASVAIRPYTRGSRCYRSGPPATVRWPKSLSAPKTSWRRGGCPGSTARRFTRGVSGKQMPRSCATSVSAVRSYLERRTPHRWRTEHLLRHVTPGTWRTHLAAARADRPRPSRLEWCRSRSARRRWDRCCVRRVLRRDGLQGELWGVVPGRGASVCRESRHTRVLHAHAGRHARALGSNGALGRCRRGVRPRRSGCCPAWSLRWPRRFRAPWQRCAVAVMSIRSIDIAGMLTPSFIQPRSTSSSTKVPGSTSSNSRSTGERLEHLGALVSRRAPDTRRALRRGEASYRGVEDEDRRGLQIHSRHPGAGRHRTCAGGPGAHRQHRE